MDLVVVPGGINEGLLLEDETDTKRRYTFGNFTKFVRPGYPELIASLGPTTLSVAVIQFLTASAAVPLVSAFVPAD